jgi:hypothetical protein
MEDRSRRPPLITGAGSGSFAAKEVHPAADPSNSPGPRGNSSRARLVPKRIGRCEFVDLRDVLRGG